MEEHQNIIFEAGWSEHEEYAHLVIYEKDGVLRRHLECHNVYTGDYNEDEEITQEDALEEMMDMIEYEEEN